jgi:hypothetical protein
VALTGFSLIWKRKDTPAGRSWWVLGRSEPRTSGSESGSSPIEWRSPTREEAGPRIETLATKDGELRLGERLYRSGGPHQSVTLGLQVEIERRIQRLAKPTATTGLLDQGSHSTSGKSRDWSTPTQADNTSTYQSDKAISEGWQPRLNEQVRGQRTMGRGVLHARWVAQLMGYPSDWCELPSDVLDALIAKR